MIYYSEPEDKIVDVVEDDPIYALVISGHALVHALHTDLEKCFMDLCSQCKYSSVLLRFSSDDHQMQKLYFREFKQLLHRIFMQVKQSFAVELPLCKKLSSSNS